MSIEIAGALKVAASADHFTRGLDAAKLQSGERASIQALLWGLKPLFDLRGGRSIPLPYAIAFLMVAIDEGKGNNEYARMMGIERRKMSRYFRDIGPQSRNGGPGLGLVAVKPGPGYVEAAGIIQKTRIVLTPKGRILADKVLRELRRLTNS